MKKIAVLFVFFLFVGVSLWAQDGDGGGSFQFNVWGIVSAVLAILSGILGKMLDTVKKKAGKVIKLGKEVLESGQAGMDLIETTFIAGADNVYDAGEQAEIKAKAVTAKKEWGDVKVAWADLLAKGV